MTRTLVGGLFVLVAAYPQSAPAPAPAAPAAKPVTPASTGMQSTGMRNENVAINPIDNNAIKEANVRVGATTTLITEPRIEAGYYATEFGRPAGSTSVLGPQPRFTPWRGDVFAAHQNSVFNARAFFQVGDVKPSRRNNWGGRASGQIGRATFLTLSGQQRKVRGMVNGNVLVPLASERTPLATDPAVRAYVQRLIDAFPTELPNRPDFDPRALNTNAPQRIDELSANARLDHDAGRLGRFSIFHDLRRNHLDNFQLVAGQNPDADVHSHRGQITWRLAPSAATEAAFGFTFNRTRTELVAEPNAVPTRTRFGFQIQELGPDSEFPVHRASNSFRYGAVVSTRLGAQHRFQWGVDLTRNQLNGIESASSRGYMSFTNNFGRPAIQNFLLGTPAFYEVTIGEFARGFRNWSANGFFADNVRVNPRLQVTFGLRYNLVTGPTEVDGYHSKLYNCDCNNFSPRFALAWQAGWGWVTRLSYTASFAEIPQVTYQQVRFNLPYVRYLQVQNPDLLNPLSGVDLSAGGRSSPTFLASDLVSPYAHQATFALERRIPSGALLRLGYTGSRSVKLLSALIQNRAQPREGIPLTLATVDERRADPRYFETRNIVNAGIGTFHAGQASLDLPVFHGLRGDIAYTFSKAIDDGVDFSGTAANGDMNRGRAQSEFNALPDRRSLSSFDSPHAMMATYSYDLPRHARGRLAWLLDNWQVAGVVLAKTGTPLTLYIGSDAPGFGNVDGGPSDRPNILDPSILGMTIPHPDIASAILTRDRFAYITPGEPRGNLSRNAFRKARIANWNAALTKQWHWGGRQEYQTQLRAEVFNLTNTPQFDEPQRNLSSPSFGRITNTLNDGRAFQISLRLFL
ncbi:MAG: TonB-dependent receptor [Bryobacteraceae bacterium]